MWRELPRLEDDELPPAPFWDSIEPYLELEKNSMKKILGLTKDEWHRFWLHFPIGGLCAWLLLQPETLALGIVLSISFLAYEVMNDWRKKDWSYKDVFGFVWGLGIVGFCIWAIGG